MIRVMQASDLGGAPADKQIDVGNTDRPGLWFEIANVSPHIFELRDEGDGVRAIIGAFQYTPLRMKIKAERLTLHWIGTQSASNLPSANFAVYAGVTQNPLSSDDPSIQLVG